jgi:hypothetical protein
MFHQLDGLFPWEEDYDEFIGPPPEAGRIRIGA